MLRDAFNKVQQTGSNRDFGTIKATIPDRTLLQRARRTMRPLNKFCKVTANALAVTLINAKHNIENVIEM